MHALLPCLILLFPSYSPQEGVRTRRSREAIVKANTKPKIARAVGQRIDNFCSVLERFYDDLGLKKNSNNLLVARLYATFEEYEATYKRQNPGEEPPLAYYSSALNAIVLYDDERDVTLRQTLFHESSHQYLNRYTTAAPLWLDEGLAEYFEGWRMAPDGTLIEERINLFDVTILQDALNQQQELRPRELVAMSWSQFRSFPDRSPHRHRYLNYVTAWGVVWFSLEGGTEEDKERLVTYLEDLDKKAGSARFQVDDWDDFEKRWRAAILDLSAEPSDAMDHVMLASGFRSSGDYKRALPEYRAAQEADPEMPGISFWMGYCNKRLGYYGKALDWFEIAREEEPENPSAPYQMAEITLGVGDPGEALELAQEASKLAGGESPGYLELVAWCQAATGEKRKALRTARKILKLVESETELDYYEEMIAELQKQ